MKGIISISAFVTLFLISSNDAFTTRVPYTSGLVSSSRANKSVLFMSDEKPQKPKRKKEDDGDKAVVLESVNEKAIYYDEELGRFFETDQECEPDDEYCAVDKSTGELVKLTLEEKERIFLDALQSYYVSGRQLLSDDDFDLLKADLQWNGSPKANLNRKEAKYIQAMQAYVKGEAIISDEEFDTLKRELKEESSPFAVSTEPKCYIDTGICTVTWQNDFFRTNLIYLPLGLIVTLGWLGLGFEVVEKIIRINPLVFLLLGAYPIYALTKSFSENFVFENPLILYGPCPSCGAENRIYFGNILGVEGFGEVAEFKCTSCKTVSRVQRQSKRVSTLPP